MRRARVASTGVTVVERLRTAQTHWTRLKGLLGTRRLAPGDGLWIKPCRQVHTIGMRYPIDLVFLADDHRVVRVVATLAPNRVSPRVAGATSVLELPSGTIARAGLAPGSLIDISGEEDEA